MVDPPVEYLKICNFPQITPFFLKTFIYMHSNNTIRRSITIRMHVHDFFSRDEAHITNMLFFQIKLIDLKLPLVLCLFFGHGEKDAGTYDISLNTYMLLNTNTSSSTYVVHHVQLYGGFRGRG